MNNTLHTSRRARRAFSARAALAAAAFALVCAGCATDQPFAGLGNILGSPAKAQTASEKSITGDINTTKAQELLYGGSREVQKIFGEKYTTQDKDRYVFVEANDAEIGVFIFAKNGEEWRLESRNNISGFDGMGFVEEIGFHQTGSGKQSVLIVSHEMGGKCQLYQVFDVTLVGAGIRVLPIEIEDECEDLYYGNEFSEFEAHFDKKSPSDDIVVSYKNQNKQRNRRFRFQNGEYKEVKAASSKKSSAKKRK